MVYFEGNAWLISRKGCEFVCFSIFLLYVLENKQGRMFNYEKLRLLIPLTSFSCHKVLSSLVIVSFLIFPALGQQ